MPGFTIFWHTGCMPKRSSIPDPDENEIAARVVGEATADEQPAKNPAAVELGRLGGLKGGKARAAKLSKRRRSEIASRAARARWSKNPRSR